MAGYPPQPVDTSVQPLPVPSAYNPITAVFKAIRGVNKVTDATPNDSYAVATSPEDGWKATYAYCLFQALPYAVPTDLITLQGSATKTIRVTRVALSGVATAAGVMQYQIIKRTAANTAGTSSSQSAAIVSYDSTSAAATAVVSLYTVIPTGLGAGRTLQGGRLYFPPLATPISNEPLARVEWGIRPAQALVLRGTTEWLAINFNGSAVPSGALVDVVIEWTEAVE
jgi:hypothetical protein